MFQMPYAQGQRNAVLNQGGGGAHPLLYDTFTDADGTNLNTHAMDIGPGWTVSGGADIHSNQARVTGVGGAGGGFLAYADAGKADGTLTCVVTLVAPLAFVAFRISDTSNFFVAGFHNGAFRIFKVVAGAGADVGNTAFAFANGVPYAVQVVLLGTSIIATVDGANQISITDAFNQTATKHGLNYENATLGTLFDDFQFV